MTDKQLIHAARAGDTTALDILLRRLKPLVKVKAKAYYLTSGDPEDLIQEGMIGLYKAVLDFDEQKNATFAAFASICIVRQIQTAIKAAARQKHMPLNTSLSLDNEFTQDDADAPDTYIDKLPDRRINDPEALFLGREALRDIDDFIRHNLSPLERDVLTHHMDGKTHAQIAEFLNKKPKSIDNSLQRIRRKIGKFHHGKSNSGK
ncbi:MAG: RNA polymerase sporulation sigma factor SigH [Defluviitaleaceae bacterium]|nr:RNA polymerase sporulation sigma factor SigH [Defluviitaleaceae bacterium]